MTNENAIYARFEALEERLAHCYFILHERFILDLQLARFWAEAALDELQHASILRFCRDHGLFANTDVDITTADRVDQLLDMMKAIVSDPEVTVDEAFYASLLMESSELDEAYEKLTRSLAADHLLLYEAIDESMQVHHEKFAGGAERFLRGKEYAEAFRSIGNTEASRKERTEP